MDNQNRCVCCSKKLQSHSSIMKCSACNASYHIQCISISKRDSIYLNRMSNPWICVRCVKDSLPFNHLDDDEFYDNTVSNYCPCIGMSLDRLNESRETFYTVDNSDHDDILNPLSDIDPDEQFYRFLPGIFNTSVYLNEHTFKNKCDESGITSINFSLIHFNVRSAPKNLSHIENYLDCLEHDFSIVGLTETWYGDHNVGLYGLSGYRQENNHRSTRGGGVCVLIKMGIDYKLRPDLVIQNADIETIFVEIDGKSINSTKKHIVGVIYRPPNRDMESFLNHLKDIMDKLKNCKHQCHFLGDYNINLLRAESHVPTSNFIDYMYSNSCIPLINKPTRVTDRSATLIDNIFTNNICDTNMMQGLLVTDVSDHFPVFVIFTEISLNEDKEEYIFKRFFHPEKVSNFCNALESTYWNDIFKDSSDAQESFTYFHTYFVNLYNKFFPLKKIKVGYKTRKSWLTTGVKNSINTKNKLFIKSVKYPTANNKRSYKNYKNRLNYTLRKLERDHFENLLTKHKSNLKKTWQIMKDIINKNKVASTPPEYFDFNGERVTDKNKIVNGFNNFYVNIGPNLCKSLPPSNVDPVSYLKNRNLHSMFIEPTNGPEIKKIIVSLKESAVGWDEISAKIIKQCTDYLLIPLTHVFNMSFTSGVFPAELKVAKVIPLYKGDSKYVLSNYRPVSVLPVLSKILERLMYNRLVSFVNEHKLLYKLQFGFRSDHSTAMALMTLVDNISNSIENGKFTLGVFLDFSKAFDCLNHKILFQKLEFYGVRDVALEWFKSYLKNRKQYVVFNKTESNYMNISCGVPQGSILGPLLFLLYVNDIVNVSTLLFPMLFADDTNVFLNGKDIDDLSITMNEELEKLYIWLKANKLSLNVKKTHYMVFRSVKKKVFQPLIPLMINGQVISKVDNTKFLGVILDIHLNWSSHINQIRSKIAKGIGIIYKTRRLLNENTLRTLYYSFVYPYFQYCIEVWGTTFKCYLDTLVKLQKSAVRCITFSNRLAHTDPLF